jgi:quercetin dioxygenase-like cupin family protein
MVADRGVQRWDELPLEKVTEMVSRKVMTGGRQMLAQVHLKRGAHVPVHVHESEQMVYVLEGGLACAVAGREMTVLEGDVLLVAARTRHQAVAIDDTFLLVVHAPAESASPSD